jgi:phosphoglycerate dehydrogenase-like enzyme
MRQIPILVLSLIFVASVTLAQGRKKVVIAGRGLSYSQIGEAELAGFRQAAPSLNIVLAEGRDRILAEVADADGIIGSINPQILKAAKNLKWVQVPVAGVESILTPELRDSNIILTNCKIAQGPEIGDHAMAMLLALTRDLHLIIPRRVKEEWPRDTYHPIELLGRRAVIIGVGGLGTNIAARAKAFGMYVTALDPREIVPSPLVDRWFPPDRLDEVLPDADVVFVSAPDTPASENMMGQKQFDLMKKGSYFIAVSRGRLYNMDALVGALKSGKLAGAGVDVTNPEPLPPGHPLWKFENVIITPHIAGRSDGEHARYMAIFRENLRRFANNEPLINVVDKQKGY